MEQPPENLAEMECTSESEVLHAIQLRFRQKRIYTNAGEVVIFVNPFEKYSIYCDKVAAMYRNGRPSESHLFSLVKSSLVASSEGTVPENIILSGESGSGKSFNFHQILRFLVLDDHAKVNHKHIDAIMSVINSFVCAKTNKNESATRCGLSAAVHLKSGSVSGLTLNVTMPLETIRVSSQRLGERNYNIFYELLANLSSEERAEYGIKEGQRFFYTTQGKTETSSSDSERLQRLLDALTVLGFTEEQRETIIKILCAILHIGNVYFRVKDPNADVQNVEIGNDMELKWAAYLLNLNFEEFKSLFVAKVVKNDDETTVIPFRMNQALDARDGFAQVLYEQMVLWIFARISNHLKCTDTSHTVTVHDYYGFEFHQSTRRLPLTQRARRHLLTPTRTNNGLDQLLINSANERIENLFVKQTLYEQMDNYIREAVHVPAEIPQYLDNSKVVEALFKKPSGILPLLDDECKFPRNSDDSYLQRCNLNHLDKSLYGKAKNKEKLEFSLKHFCGTSLYNVTNFIAQNRRFVPSGLLKSVAGSSNAVIALIFRSISSQYERMDYSTYRANQLVTMVNNTMEQLMNGNSQYIRCIRSNNQRQPAVFDITTVSRQLKAFAVSEVLTFRLKGFPIRIPFLKFAQSYRCLLPSDITICHKQKEIILDVLESQGVKYAGDYKIGRNYVFLREKLAVRLEERRESVLKSAALVVQKTVRAFVRRKQFLSKRRAIVTLQAGLRGWKARKETSQMREELLKKLGKQTRRTRRLEAYHDGIKDPTDTLAPTTVTDYIDVAPVVNDTKIVDRENGKPEMVVTTKYIAESSRKDVQIEEVPFEEFAEKNYRGHLIEIRREPIMTPFLHKDNDIDFQLSTEIFKLILKFMNDRKLSQEHLNQLARFIAQQGIQNVSQRDEIYVQVMNQLYNNRDKIATERGQLLLHLAAQSFPPSEEVLPVLIWFARTMHTSSGRKLTESLQRRLRVRGLLRSRLVPGSELELSSQHSGIVLQLTCPDEETAEVEAHSWNTCSEVANTVLRSRGIGNPRGWTIEMEGSRIFSSAGHHFIHDVIADCQYEAEENKFLNFSNERTLPSMKKQLSKQPPKTPEPQRKATMMKSPKPRRQEMSPVGLRRLPMNDELESSVEYEDENPYCYTVPTKNRLPSSGPERIAYGKTGEVEYMKSPPPQSRPAPYQAPMIQYVPVMVPQTMMGQMGGYAVMPMMPSNQVDEQNNHNEPSRNLHKENFETMRSVGSRHEWNPSDYSTMSVASRIRRMPIPEKGGDVDRFLDQVFDQVLPPEELNKIESIDSRDIAGAIKGGDPSLYDQAYERIPSHHYEYMNNSSDQYDYVDRERMGGRRDHSRTRSLPRTTLNRSHHSNGYSQIQESRDSNHDTIQRPLTFEPPSTPIPPAPTQLPRQPMVMMMPVQVDEDGRMIPLMMSSQQGLQYPRTFPQGYPVDSTLMTTMQRRDPSPQGRVSRTSRRAVTPSKYEQDLHMRATLQPYREIRSPSVNEQIPRISTAGPKSPAQEHKGLNRIPIEKYADPIVQNTTSNSEHFNPNKLRIPEKNLVKERKELENEAIRKINEKLKNLPPPVEKVRLYFPKPPPAPRPPEPKREFEIPDEPSFSYFATEPADPAPAPVPTNEPLHINVEPEYPPQVQWVFDGDVERPPEFQKRIKGAKPSLPTETPKTNGVKLIKEVKEEEKPAVKYKKQPWKLTIRKEMFYPSEKLDDAKVIDQVFAQIIVDCRRAIAYRIRSYEREDVVDILKANSIPPDMLNHQSEIPTAVKVQVVEAARRWPLYFSQIYEVLEERMDETVSVLLSISEHGVRLLMHTPQDSENPLKVQDHFLFNDILDVVQESENVVIINTRSQMSVRIRSDMASQIAEEINKCLFGVVKDRQFFRAITDFTTTQASMLSFKANDIIEIVDRPDGEEVPGTWLYGKIGTRFGNFAAEYAVPLNENEASTAPPTLPVEISNSYVRNGHSTDTASSIEGRSINGYLDDQQNMTLSRHGEEKYTMMEFAMKNFRVPKNSDRRTRNGNWTWQEVAQLVKYTDRPISHSLLKLDSNELDRLATDAFMCVMRYMGDEPPKRGDTVTDLVYRLLIICKKNPIMKDEVYCQVIRQTTNNRSTKPDSTIRGWRLMFILTSYFDCSLSLKPYLLSYLADNADDLRRAYHGTALNCLDNLKQTFQYGGRKMLLGGKEVEEITNGKVLKRQVYMLPGGHKKVINTKSVTVVEEVIQEICQELNILNTSEQHEFSLCCVHEQGDKIDYLSNSDYILDICTSLDHQKITYHFLLRRDVWVHPLRLDNPIYIDVIFFQILPEYLLGTYIENSTGALSAAMTEDVVHLAALLHTAANEGRRVRVAGKSIQSLIPTTVLDLKMMSAESWADRINRRLHDVDRLSPLHARTAFIELLIKWPMFGVTLFRSQKCSVDGRALPELSVTVGRKGITLLQPLSHRIFDAWGFEKIISTATRKTDTIVMTVKNGQQSKTVELQSPDATSIERLIAQYKFVLKESEALLS